jgi:hypothetical protein
VTRAALRPRNPVVTTPGRRVWGQAQAQPRACGTVGGGELVFLIPVEECACGPVFPHRGDRDKVARPRQSRSFGALRFYEVRRQDFATSNRRCCRKFRYRTRATPTADQRGLLGCRPLGRSRRPSVLPAAPHGVSSKRSAVPRSRRPAPIRDLLARPGRRS